MPPATSRTNLIPARPTCPQRRRAPLTTATCTTTLAIGKGTEAHGAERTRCPAPARPTGPLCARHRAWPSRHPIPYGLPASVRAMRRSWIKGTRSRSKRTKRMMSNRMTKQRPAASGPTGSRTSPTCSLCRTSSSSTSASPPPRMPLCIGHSSARMGSPWPSSCETSTTRRTSTRKSSESSPCCSKGTRACRRWCAGTTSWRPARTPSCASSSRTRTSNRLCSASPRRSAATCTTRSPPSTTCTPETCCTETSSPATSCGTKRRGGPPSLTSTWPPSTRRSGCTGAAWARTAKRLRGHGRVHGARAAADRRRGGGVAG